MTGDCNNAMNNKRNTFEVLRDIITFCTQTAQRFTNIISQPECMYDIWIIHESTYNRKIFNDSKHLSANNAYNVYNATKPIKWLQVTNSIIITMATMNAIVIITYTKDQISKTLIVLNSTSKHK